MMLSFASLVELVSQLRGSGRDSEAAAALDANFGAAALDDEKVALYEMRAALIAKADGDLAAAQFMLAAMDREELPGLLIAAARFSDALPADAAGALLERAASASPADGFDRFFARTVAARRNLGAGRPDLAAAAIMLACAEVEPYELTGTWPDGAIVKGLADARQRAALSRYVDVYCRVHEMRPDKRLAENLSKAQLFLKDLDRSSS